MIDLSRKEQQEKENNSDPRVIDLLEYLSW